MSTRPDPQEGAEEGTAAQGAATRGAGAPVDDVRVRGGSDRAPGVPPGRAPRPAERDGRRADASLHRPHRPVRRRQVAGDARARGPCLLLRRQPADHAAADVRRADAAARHRDREGRGGDRRARGRAARKVPARVRDAAGDARPQPHADLPRSQRGGAGAPLQRDAPAASAGPASIGARGRAGRAGAAGADPADRRRDRRHVRHERPRTARGLHGAAHSGPRGPARCRSRSSASGSSTGCRSTPTWSSTCASCPTRTSSRGCASGPAASGRSCSSWIASRTPASSSRRSTDLLQFLIPRYAREGKSYLTVAIGCTGGRHRSVAMAEALAKALRGLNGVRFRVRHRDVAND